MTYRARLILSFLAVSLLPILALAWIVRSEMSSRLTRQYGEELDARIAELEQEWLDIGAGLDARSTALIRAILDDNRFRMAVEREEDDRTYLLDYTEKALSLNGLAALQIQDGSGRIVSSGHFRNDFDRLDDRLLPGLRSARRIRQGPVLVVLPTAEGPIHVAARADSFRVSGRAFTLVAGMSLDKEFLSASGPGRPVSTSILLPDGTQLRSGAHDDESVGAQGENGFIERSFAVPFLDGNRDVGEARVVARRDLAGLQALQNRVDGWILIVVVLAGIAAAVLVAWNASLLSRPLAELARKADAVDLDRLDVDFRTKRHDEIGRLSGVLHRMTHRLRAGKVSLREAERRAATGDLARQVNHDVKNGLMPIRNIVRHLAGLSADRSDELSDTFAERLPALDAGIAYLESLSANYGRLSRSTAKAPIDVGEVCRQVAKDYGTGRAYRIEVKTVTCPPVLADQISLRRIVENLVSNAVDSLQGKRGRVGITVEPFTDERGRQYTRMSVADSGSGMSAEARNRIFENFYTTKEKGTGLGLSIVRRLTMDLGGSISVESEPGKGSRFSVDFPVASSAPVTETSP